MVDGADSKSAEGNLMRVRVPPSAPALANGEQKCSPFVFFKKQAGDSRSQVRGISSWQIKKSDDYIRGSTTAWNSNYRALGSIFCCQKMQRFYARNFFFTDQTRNMLCNFGRYSRAKFLLRSLFWSNNLTCWDSN